MTLPSAKQAHFAEQRLLSRLAASDGAAPVQSPIARRSFTRLWNAFLTVRALIAVALLVLQGLAWMMGRTARQLSLWVCGT